MKILLTNDDGIESKITRALFDKLRENHDVNLIAPKKDKSGQGAAITLRTSVQVEKQDENIYAVDGTPADCSYLGLLSIVDFEFDIVISGINHGANIGNDVLYSGTVGAAVGGRNLKYPPIAISVATYDAKDIEFISKKSIELINMIIKSEEIFMGKIININFPDITENEFKGCLATGLSKRDVPAEPIKIDESSLPKESYKYRYNLSGEPLSDNFLTDAEAVKDGYVSISVLDYSLGSSSYINDIKKILDD